MVAWIINSVQILVASAFFRAPPLAVSNSSNSPSTLRWSAFNRSMALVFAFTAVSMIIGLCFRPASNDADARFVPGGGLFRERAVPDRAGRRPAWHDRAGGAALRGQC